MYKLLVVDDEALIREGIADGIDWGRLECDEPFLANNGLEAVEIIKNNAIDIVITDIKMPGMSGIELAEWISLNRKEIHVIILSGYDDFKFAQSALSCGVNNYILKPTKFDELEDSIEKAKKKIKERCEMEEINCRSKEILETRNKQAIVDSLIFHRISNAEDLKHHLEHMEHAILFHRISILQIFNYSPDFLENSSYIIEFVKYIEEAIKSSMSKKHVDVLVRFETDEIVIYLSSGNPLLSPEEFLQETDAVLAELKRKTDEFIPFDTAMGASYIGNSLNSLKNLYNEAAYKCDLEKQKVFFKQGSLANNKNLYELLNPDFHNHLLQRDHRVIAGDIDEFFLKLSDKPLSFLKGVAIELINHVTTFCGGEAVNRYIDMQRVYGEVIQSTDRNSAAYIVKEALKKIYLSPEMAAADGEDSRELVDKILGYIRKNFFNDLSLDHVAEKFYISSGHLSRLLRKNCHMTFLDTVTKIRIENAKILLKNPRYKAYEVGLMVGFKDSKYFSQVFKKYTGRTPSEFK